MTARGWAGAALAALALTLALAACGGEEAEAQVASLGDETTTTGPTEDAPAGDADRQEALLAFAQCMREHGVDMPDPQFGEGGGGLRIRRGQADDPDFPEAQAACREHLENARPQNLDPEQQEELREAVLAFAQCMREHGVDMPDPQFGEGGGVRVGGPGLNPNDPKFREAQEACQDELPDFRRRP